MIRSLRPEVQLFIDEQVKSGRFPTPEAVVEAAILDWHDAALGIDDETAVAINEAEAQADRGEGIDLDAFRAEFFNHFAGSQ